MLLEMLKEMRGGALDSEGGDRLRELVQAVRATGKGGKLVLSITVKPATKGDNHALLVADQIRVSLPQVSAGETVLFSNDEGALSRRDPRQPELRGLSEVLSMRRSVEGAVNQ